MKRVYIVLCILGACVPYLFFAPFLAANGLNLGLFVSQMFASPVAAFFSADVLFSSVALWVFIFYENRQRPVRLWWLCLIANLTVGVSLALPLFLLLRQTALEQGADGKSQR